MTHVLAAARYAKTSFNTYWPPAVIGFGLAATVIWTAFLGHVALSLVHRLALPLIGSLTH